MERNENRFYPTLPTAPNPEIAEANSYRIQKILDVKILLKKVKMIEDVTDAVIKYCWQKMSYLTYFVLKMTEEILQINNFSLDESIERYENKEYSPISGATNLNSGGEIRIIIQHDQFIHPCESYLLTEGRVTKADNTSITDEDQITFCNNGLMYMIDWIKYELSGTEIEYLNYLGQAAMMFGMLTDSDGFKKKRWFEYVS